ncbi:MAG: 50S ribosomal protein L17 [Candidatus Daviesbacteria bacterium]|nr:50S ribosomal protein L17 [Candidatus Daviesbacteria bacterium]
MRHRVYGKHLGRNKDERKNLFKGLVRLLLIHGTIQTSETKAKAIKGLVDRIINLAKDKRETRLKSFLVDKNLRERLIKDIIPRLSVARTSGYTSIVRMGTRLGDQTTMVKMSLIGVEELKPLEKESSSKNQELSKKPEKPKKKTITTPRKSIKVKTVKTKKGAKKA